jgi:acyl-CoA synthetase (AMP-forming)/AMP-acid ligase II
MSTRNSSAAVNSMLRKLSVHQLVVTAASMQSLLEEVGLELVIDNYHLDVIELPSLAEIYPQLAKETQTDPFIPVPAVEAKSFDDRTVIYLHSSGSTGFPKPIPWTNAFIRSLANIDVAKRLRAMPPHTGKNPATIDLLSTDDLYFFSDRSLWTT